MPHPLPRLLANGDEVDLHPPEMLPRLDETIHSVDHETETLERPHLNETSIGHLHEVLDSPLPHHPTISDATVQELDNLEEIGRVLNLDLDRPMVRAHGEAISLLLLLSRLGLEVGLDLDRAVLVWLLLSPLDWPIPSLL